MLTTKRQKLIAEYVDKHQFCNVAELCELTASSESTIRRDLSEMAGRGELERIHGGARSISALSKDIAQQIRFTLKRTDKIAIANFAVSSHVHNGDVIFLDAGTSVYEMTSFLKDYSDLVVVTNSVDTALACINAGIETHLLGGKIKAATHAVIGDVALSQLAEMHFNAAFLGTNGLSSTGGLSTPDPDEAAIKKHTISAANQVFVLVDHSKFGKQAFAKFATIEQVTVLTTTCTHGDWQVLPDKIQIEEVQI